jgi:hypothetical protein
METVVWLTPAMRAISRWVTLRVFGDMPWFQSKLIMPICRPWR